MKPGDQLRGTGKGQRKASAPSEEAYRISGGRPGTPYRQSPDDGRDTGILPQHPPFSRPPVRPNGGLRGLPQKQTPATLDEKGNSRH